MSTDLPADLTDADWLALDTALAETSAADPSWLDGYWAGLALQPEPPDTGAATAAALDVAAPAPVLITTLARQRVQFLRAAWRAQDWWDPFVRAPQDEALSWPDASVDAAAAPPAVSPAFLGEALGPWVAGLEQALHDFPLAAVEGEPTDPAGMMVLARLYRHLPAQGPQEQTLVDLLNQAHPLDSLEDAVDELTACVAELWDLSRPPPPAADPLSTSGPG
ncbi:MAG: hypothetical protein V4739_19480 [Pseudomonadota bacterium]